MSLVATPAAEAVRVLTSSTKKRLVVAALDWYQYARTSLSATGLYSTPNCSSGTVPAVPAGLSVAGWVYIGGPVTVAPGTITTSGWMKWVIVPSGSRKSMTLTRNWVSWTLSSRVSTAIG